ncbi:hypothetical protein BX281_2693 [Streptomyces sp. Ag82_O1-15]|uniref:hypothetical protein n=1 Tax=Streptomyces sp. Ag82_O1-15 TaxID=1938855 RepID=UPI000BB12FB5|nr:hypothetical protein [Streptomyces sp. Ag82_O1-15]PBC94770.1 hypothetical protein BX281_2693 [Streptomyces sp. Ag82_O1-15]
MLDHRLVQTAVIGDARSDHPVILPMEFTELEAWRRRHPNYTYWCGYELGGCGGRLMDRLYHDKVCHFAHVAGGPTCGRAATGESSADHLFIKRGLRDLLSKHGQRGDVRTHDLGSGPGGAVDLHLPAARRKLRFQLAPLDYQGWRHAGAALGEDIDDVDWLFGAEGPLTKEVLARNGYSLRFRLETDGGERRVHIGAQARNEPADWTPLDECELRSDGIWTPAVEKIRVSPPRPQPAGFPLEGGLVFALDHKAPVPDSSPFSIDGRRLVMADVKPIGSPIIRAVLSLPADTRLPPARHVFRAPDHSRLLVREDGGWAIHIDRYLQLSAMDAAQTGLGRVLPEPQRTPLPASVPQVKTAVTKSVKVRASRAVDQPQKPNEPETLSWSKAVVRAREILMASAAQGCTLSWSTLIHQLGNPYWARSESFRIGFLVEVDSPLQEGEPVLSAVLGEEGGTLPYLPAVLERLGMDGFAGISADSSAVRRWTECERERAFAAHAKPPRVMPSRPELRQLDDTPGSTKKPKEVAVVSNDRAREGGRIELTGFQAQNSTAEERRKVSEAIDRVQRKTSVLGSGHPANKRAHRAVRLGCAWLKFATPGCVIPAIPTKRQRRALRANASDLLAELNLTTMELAAVKAKF